MSRAIGYAPGGALKCRSMDSARNTCRLLRVAAICLTACSALTPQCRSQQNVQRAPLEKFEATLAALASASADDCGWEAPRRKFSGDSSKLEDELFAEADDAIVQALNSRGAEPTEAIADTLDSMRTASDRVNRDWPADRRFHYTLLTIEPAFVVVYHVRSRSTWSVFAVPSEAEWPDRGKNIQWKQVGEDDFRWQDAKGDQHIEVYSLQRGPSGLPRFLSKASEVSCGDGITGVTWQAYEWNSSGFGSFDTIIERTGAESRGDYAQYHPIGKLRTDGKRITLPYCEWSPVDLDVDALLCSVDTYDVSGDDVRFISTETNRPDLEAVAKAIQYGEARDYRAELGYSVSPDVARQLVEQMPPGILENRSGEDYPPLRGDHQKIAIEGLHFELERHDGRWVVVRFTLDPGD